MQFFLDMHSAHAYGRHNNPFPDWFTFSDDDYYVRISALGSYLVASALPPSAPLAVVTLGGLRSAAARDGRTVTRLGFGAHIFNANCTNPCVHSIPVRPWYCCRNPQSARMRCMTYEYGMVIVRAGTFSLSL